MDGDGLLSKCTAHMDVCGMGVVIGIIIALILIFLYMSYTTKKAEGFVDPNDLDPQTKALLTMHNAADPGSNYMMKKMYGINA
jgi:Na+-transporting methylmalonyl-CoA/oxaloacetate decarboxylase gamma subunit